MRKQKSISSLGMLLIIAMLLSGCAGSKASDPTVTLKIAALPILDSLPLHVANQEGLFAKHHIQVELVSVGSAPERDQLIAAGQADGMITEVTSTMFFNKEKVQVQIVRYARVAAPNAPQFQILASAKSGITSVDGLKGVEIGVSQGTVIEYVTDRMLQAEGLAPGEIKTIAVPKISDRLALLGSGELQAGVLPDPQSDLAQQSGAKVIVDGSRYPQYAYSVFSFRKAVIDEHPEAIRAFLAALEEATAMLNKDPEKWSGLLSELKLIPASLTGSFKIGPYPAAGIPSKEQWNDALAWCQAKGLLTVDVPYEDSVNPNLLP